MNEFGLVGKSLKHSFSAKYFNEKFQRDGIKDCNYQLFELPKIEDLSHLLKQHPNLKGLNITTPYKESILPYLDKKEDVVEEIGACNCVKIENGKLIGYNTDVNGFMISILSLLEHQHHKAIILGNGGAAKAVKFALEQISIDYQVIARTPRSDSELAWDKLDREMMDEYKIIINTTPVGMWPSVSEFPDIPYDGFSRFHLAFDLIYNPEKTVFLKKAEQEDAVVKNGLEMLEQQAEAAWEIFGT